MFRGSSAPADPRCQTATCIVRLPVVITAIGRQHQPGKAPRSCASHGCGVPDQLHRAYCIRNNRLGAHPRRSSITIRPHHLADFPYRRGAASGQPRSLLQPPASVQPCVLSIRALQPGPSNRHSCAPTRSVEIDSHCPRRWPVLLEPNRRQIGKTVSSARSAASRLRQSGDQVTVTSAYPGGYFLCRIGARKVFSVCSSEAVAV